MTEGVPLCIPEVNAGAVDSITLGEGGIVANPNCSTIIALMAVTPLHRKASVQRMVVSTYQVRLRGLGLGTRVQGAGFSIVCQGARQLKLSLGWLTSLSAGQACDNCSHIGRPGAWELEPSRPIFLAGMVSCQPASTLPDISPGSAQGTKQQGAIVRLV